jgi:hypothetical protein
MQRSLSRGITVVLSLLALTVAPACKDDKADAGKQEGKQPQQAPSGDVSAGPGQLEAEENLAEAGQPATEPKPSEGQPVGGPEQPTTAADGGEPPTPEPAAVDPAPMLESAKSLDTDDEAAKKALADAIAAGASKVDAAKTANARGEALMAKGESERAAEFFEWSAKTHTLLSEPVYNLATLAAYAGDLEVAKEHLQELQKRGNKKLMKKVGVDPAFAPLHDDADVRKIYEQ